ncbi:DUF2281 domain-containing protein [Cyclobacterium sp. SYSU L10401]|uniref:DUF2281 domain-containing protein n=1 Tax=Cyclobacterium sp. SYSU L10401 TaxID=2678657 RepID=UPI0013D4A9AD|nr:DUF2281 domain-containing protein [Cyclobacterium sp. SYSU L10401]
MTKKGLIHRTVETLEKLPEDRIQEIADFADFVLKKNEEQLRQKQGVEKAGENAVTRHAMRLSESSLNEDWENEEDSHWDSFLE